MAPAMTLVSPTHNLVSFTREEPPPVATSLRGRRIRIPDLGPFYSRWEDGMNPLYEELSRSTLAEMRQFLPDKKQIRKVEALDGAFFSSSWYPKLQSWDRLRTLAMLCIWVFLWDDELDDELDGEDATENSIVADIDKGDLYRSQSLAHINYHLGLCPPGTPEPAAPTIVQSLLADVCHAFREASRPEAVVSFANALADFINSTAVEQRFRISGYMPTPEEYWKLRTATIGTRMMCAVAQYACFADLPADLVTSDATEGIYREFTRNLIIMNDLLSLKKEVKEGTFFSYVHVFLHSNPSQTIDGVVDQMVSEIADSRVQFDRYAAALRAAAEQAGHDDRVRGDVDRFVKVFESSMTGCLKWTMRSRRYGMAELIKPDGSLDIEL